MKDHELPVHLSHRPVYALFYRHFDKYAPDTDVRWISIGFPEWDQTVSVKVMRWVGGDNGRWSRQAEELPLTRAIDLATVIALTVQEVQARAKAGREGDPLSDITVRPGVFHNQDEPANLGVRPAWPVTKGEVDLLQGVLLSEETLGRLRALKDVLNTIDLRKNKAKAA